MMEILDGNQELRKLPAGSLNPVIDILEIDDYWQTLMGIIPKNPEDLDSDLKYNSEHVRRIKEYADCSKLKGAKVLFDEWGSSGRIRPTLRSLMRILVKAQLYRAADEIADMLKEPRPRRPTDGPAASIDTSHITAILDTQSIGQDPAQSMGLGTTAQIKSESNKNENKSVEEQKKVTQEMLPGPFDHNEYLIPDIDNLNPKSGKMAGQNTGHTTEYSSKPYFSDDTQTDSSIAYSDYSKVLHDIDSDLLKKNENKSVEEQKKVTQEMLSGPFDYNEYWIPDIDNLNPKSGKMAGQNTGFTTEYSSKPYFSDDTQTDSSISYSDYSKVIHDIDADLLKNSNLIQFEYRFLVTITRNFTNHIGSGGFGDVYIGTDPNYGQLAVKKTRNQHSADSRFDFIKIFNREVRSLSHLRHENIVPILGFSLSGPDPCIVCRYIDGGSLIQKLADKVLSEAERINIIVGVSEGLKYIHNTVLPGITQEMKDANVKYYFLHGDVKSANILLTKEFVPKLCDFGLAKQYTSTHFTMAIMGTSPYMAPESYHGTVTQKSDIFSFGVVLLEVLTGLKPVVKTSQGEVNLRSYINDTYNGDITNVLDSVANWTKAAKIYNLAKLCLKKDKETRPSMAEICEMLCVIKKLQPKTDNVV